MKNQYLIIRLALSEEDFEIAYAVLMDFPVSGIEEHFDELSITFNKLNFSYNMPDKIIEALKSTGVNADIIEINEIDDKNWNEEYEKKTKAIIVNNKIGITPSWKIDELENPVKIKINPKMSFGTGEHASTRLIAQLMDGVVKKDSFWVDAGTGTGILAVLAVKLGAGRCYAFDNNEWSFENAQENIQLNETVSSIDLEMKDIDDIRIPEADGIAANIFFNIIINNFDKFYN